MNILVDFLRRNSIDSIFVFFLGVESYYCAALTQCLAVWFGCIYKIQTDQDMQFWNDSFSRSSEKISPIFVVATAYLLCVIMKVNDQLPAARIWFFSPAQFVELAKKLEEKWVI